MHALFFFLPPWSHTTLRRSIPSRCPLKSKRAQGALVSTPDTIVTNIHTTRHIERTPAQRHSTGGGGKNPHHFSYEENEKQQQQKTSILLSSKSRGEKNHTTTANHLVKTILLTQRRIVFFFFPFSKPNRHVVHIYNFLDLYISSLLFFFFFSPGHVLLNDDRRR